MRRAAPALLLLVAGCGQSVGGAGVDAGAQHIACALGPQAPLRNDCTLERHRERQGLFLTLRHPDGGFRRLAVLADGSGLAEADGALPLRSARSGDRIDIAVGDDRYSIPASALSDKPYE